MADKFSPVQVEELAKVLQGLPNFEKPSDLHQIVNALRSSCQSAFTAADIDGIASAVAALDVPLATRPSWGVPNGKQRGLFLVFEGLDRSGKSTQSKRLAKSLEQARPVKWMCFPNRATPTGLLIDLYLRKMIELPDNAVHLLFSANRWETATSIVQDILSGTSVVCDRYAFSGVAYSAAKGLDFTWCREPDRGLPCPDGVFFMRIDETEGSKRSGFGDERYENATMQATVRSQFQNPELHNTVPWHQIDGARDIEVIEKEIREAVAAIQKNEEENVSWPVPSLWIQ